MKALKFLIVIMFVSFVLSIRADEIVLQNGLNGYKGCEDAFFMKDFPNDNLGSNKQIMLQYWDC